jgi:hypothetical protein
LTNDHLSQARDIGKPFIFAKLLVWLIWAHTRLHSCNHGGALCKRILLCLPCQRSRHPLLLVFSGPLLG